MNYILSQYTTFYDSAGQCTAFYDSAVQCTLFYDSAVQWLHSMTVQYNAVHSFYDNAVQWTVAVKLNAGRLGKRADSRLLPKQKMVDYTLKFRTSP